VAAAWWGSSLHDSLPGQLPVERAVGLAVIVALAAALTRQTVTARALRRRNDELASAAPAMTGLPVGTKAPDFDLPGIDDTRTSLATLLKAGRPVVLIFVHRRCEPCHLLFQELPAWQEELGRSLTIVPIGSGDVQLNAEWAREHRIDRLLVQHRTDVSSRYQVRGTPSAVLVDPAGRIAAPLAQSVAAIADLLAAIKASDRPLPAATREE
jgi:peroxiredoxin